MLNVLGSLLQSYVGSAVKGIKSRNQNLAPRLLNLSLISMLKTQIFVSMVTRKANAFAAHITVVSVQILHAFKNLSD